MANARKSRASMVVGGEVYVSVIAYAYEVSGPIAPPVLGFGSLRTFLLQQNYMII